MQITRAPTRISRYNTFVSTRYGAYHKIHYRQHVMPHPFMSSSNRAPHSLQLDWQTLNFEAHLIGKSIITFTMLYCGLNWAMYKAAQDKQKHNDAKNDESNSKKD
jgi:hypothetical protein